MSSTVLLVPEESAASPSPRVGFRGAAIDLLHHRTAVIGLTFVLTLIAMALLADVLSPADRAGLKFPPNQPPSFEFLMGTDGLGRDVFHRFLQGARVSIAIGLIAAVTSTFIGIAVGVLAGYRGAATDDGLMRLTEAVQVTPRFFLALLVAVLFGASFLNVALIIGLLSWPSIARLTRAEALAIREHEYIVAARAIGVSDRRIMFSEIVPNAIAPSIIAGSLLVAQAILIESALSFLGLGDPSRPTWGLMLNEAQGFYRTAWWLSVFPGLGIMIASLGFNMLGDGLNDVMNPRLRAR
jgi:peptide/nickel transport system permease protein